MARGETVDELVRIVRQHAPEITDAQLERFARLVHEHLGGKRWYIPHKEKRAPQRPSAKR